MWLSCSYLVVILLLSGSYRELSCGIVRYPELSHHSARNTGQIHSEKKCLMSSVIDVCKKYLTSFFVFNDHMALYIFRLPCSCQYLDNK